MTEVSVVVLAIERLETFAANYLVDLRERPRTIEPFVELIGRLMVDEAAEHLRWVASSSVTLVRRPQILEELGDVHAGPVGQVLGFVLIFRAVTARVARDDGSESFEVAAIEHSCAIVASEADQRPDLAVGVCRCVCTEHPGRAARGEAKSKCLVCVQTAIRCTLDRRQIETTLSPFARAVRMASTGSP